MTGEPSERVLKRPKGHADLFAVNGGQTFATWLLEQGYSGRTIELYGLYARRAAEHLRAQGRSLSRATEDDVRDFWRTLPMSSSSRNGARHALIAWYRFRGKRDGGPAHLLERVPAPPTYPRPVSDLDHADMLRAAREMGGVWEMYGSLLGLTGCRFSEARRAKWHQFDLRGDNPVWYIEGKGSRRRGPKIRQVPLAHELVDAIVRWRGECGSPEWVFPSETSSTGYVSPRYLTDRLAEVCERAGIEWSSAHVWRHTVATIAVERTDNLLAVGGLLGHVNPSTTAIYTKLSAGKLRIVVECLERQEDDGDPEAA